MSNYWENLQSRINAAKPPKVVAMQAQREARNVALQRNQAQSQSLKQCEEQIAAMNKRSGVSEE
jgi:hypothetical protein